MTVRPARAPWWRSRTAAQIRARYLPEGKTLSAVLFSDDPDESASAIVLLVLAVTGPFLVPLERLERFIRWDLARLRARPAPRRSGRPVKS
jgi:hypothetical protein